MSREAFGDPPESQEPPQVCPVCGNDWHAEDCEFGKEVARRLKAERDAHKMAFENEQLRRLSSLDAMRAGKLAADVERYSALHAALFAQKTNALRRASEAEQDAARFRMLQQQHKHWLGVFRCDPDGAPSDSLDHVELKATLDALIAQEPAPSCHTPEGCRENGCLGWCDEHKPEAAKP